MEKIARSEQTHQFRIISIILAAGAGNRFGGDIPKQLMLIDGVPSVRIVVQKSLLAGFETIVVTGANAGRISDALKDLSTQIVYNPDWEKGQSTSLRKGMEAISGRADSLCAMLADQPLIKVETLLKLAAEQARFPEEIIVPAYNEKRGNPGFFPAKYIESLYQLSTGDQGGRALIKQFGARMVPVDDAGVTLDFDTIEDYRNIIQRKNN